jgi:hypothetical protein
MNLLDTFTNEVKQGWQDAKHDLTRNYDQEELNKRHKKVLATMFGSDVANDLVKGGPKYRDYGGGVEVENSEPKYDYERDYAKEQALNMTDNIVNEVGNQNNTKLAYKEKSVFLRPITKQPHSEKDDIDKSSTAVEVDTKSKNGHSNGSKSDTAPIPSTADYIKPTTNKVDAQGLHTKNVNPLTTRSDGEIVADIIDTVRTDSKGHYSEYDVGKVLGSSVLVQQLKTTNEGRAFLEEITKDTGTRSSRLGQSKIYPRLPGNLELSDKDKLAMQEAKQILYNINKDGGFLTNAAINDALKHGSLVRDTKLLNRLVPTLDLHENKILTNQDKLAMKELETALHKINGGDEFLNRDTVNALVQAGIPIHDTTDAVVGPSSVDLRTNSTDGSGTHNTLPTFDLKNNLAEIVDSVYSGTTIPSGVLTLKNTPKWLRTQLAKEGLSKVTNSNDRTAIQSYPNPKAGPVKSLPVFNVNTGNVGTSSKTKDLDQPEKDVAEYLSEVEENYPQTPKRVETVLDMEMEYLGDLGHTFGNLTPEEAATMVRNHYVNEKGTKDLINKLKYVVPKSTTDYLETQLKAGNLEPSKKQQDRNEVISALINAEGSYKYGYSEPAIQTAKNYLRTNGSDLLIEQALKNMEYNKKQFSRYENSNMGIPKDMKRLAIINFD